MKQTKTTSALRKAAQEMADFSFSAVEQKVGYEAALKEFCLRKRQLRAALETTVIYRANA